MWNKQLKLISQRNGAMKQKIFSVFLLKQTTSFFKINVSGLDCLVPLLIYFWSYQILPNLSEISEEFSTRHRAGEVAFCANTKDLISLSFLESSFINVEI